METRIDVDEALPRFRLATLKGPWKVDEAVVRGCDEITDLAFRRVRQTPKKGTFGGHDGLEIFEKLIGGGGDARYEIVSVPENGPN